MNSNLQYSKKLFDINNVLKSTFLTLLLGKKAFHNSYKPISSRLFISNIIYDIPGLNLKTDNIIFANLSSAYIPFSLYNNGIFSYSSSFIFSSSSFSLLWFELKVISLFNILIKFSFIILYFLS